MSSDNYSEQLRQDPEIIGNLTEVIEVAANTANAYNIMALEAQAIAEADAATKRASEQPDTTTNEASSSQSNVVDLDTRKIRNTIKDIVDEAFHPRAA